MIVPRSSLLWGVGLVVVPAATVAAVVPPAGPVLYALIGLCAVAIAADGVLAWSRRGVLAVACPEPARLAKDRPGTIPLQLGNPARRARRVRLALAWPEELRPDQEDLRVSLPAQAETARVDWPVTPTRRGRFVLDRCYVESTSPLGLWAARTSVAADVEVRVYPNLITERKTLSALLLNRGQLGVHAQRQVGKGRDFEKLRDYLRGDSYDDIHWKATAKRGRPVTKIFQIERTQEVYVVIDTSRLSARRPGGAEPAGAEAPASDGPAPAVSVLERFLTAGMILALAAEKQGDLFGFLTFSDRVDTFVPARRGKVHYGACRDALYTAQPRIVTPDFDDLCSFLRLRLRRRALLVVLTSLDDPILAESFTRSIQLICRHHLVLVNVLRTPGTEELFSEESVERTDDLYRALGGHVRWQQLLELEKRLRRHGISFARLDNESLCADLVSQYVTIKQRQLL
jgi:uncharacterized protein (DUF58 family)